MTVENQLPIQHFTANGSTTVFAFSFAVEGNDNFKVTVNGTKVSINDYNYDASLNAVVFNTAPVAGSEVIVERETTIDRAITYETYDNSFRPEVLNEDLDRIIRILQELNYTDDVIIEDLANEIYIRTQQVQQINEELDLHAITLEVIQQKQQQETINRINGDNEVALSSREYTDFMLRMNNTNPSIFSGISDNIVITEKGETQRQLNNKMITNGEFPKVLGERSIRLDINTAKSSFRYGLNDPLPLDNNTNMFKGLTNKDAWADENLGIGSVAFGRNGASYAYLSTTYGHDCITYGVASTAGGAGSGTGNPDLPNDGANYGYCSLAHGKDTLAKGRISTAFGEQCVAGSIYSYSSGRESISGEGLSTHPNLLGGSGVVSEGRGAFTHGYRCYAYGNDSIAFGSSVTAYNGAQIIGTGINVGSPLLNSLPNSIAFGRNVDVPTILIEGTQGNGVNNAFGKVGFNTKRPKERVEIVVNNQDKVAIRSKNGGASFDLQGTLGTGDSTSIFRIEYTSPNGGQAYGTTNFYQNNQNWLSLNESGDPTFKKVVDSLYGYRVDGTKVIGGQLNPITSLETTATLEQTINKINEVIVALRSHGLIAT